jgi:hypothetical protein
VGKYASGVRIVESLTDRLNHVEVVQHIFEAAIVWQAIEKRTNGFLGSHVNLRLTTSITPGCLGEPLGEQGCGLTPISPHPPWSFYLASRRCNRKPRGSALAVHSKSSFRMRLLQSFSLIFRRRRKQATSGISRGATTSIAPSAACHVMPPVDQLARRFAKSALTAGTSLTGIFITVVVVDRYAASSSATASTSDWFS